MNSSLLSKMMKKTGIQYLIYQYDHLFYLSISLSLIIQGIAVFIQNIFNSNFDSLFINAFSQKKSHVQYTIILYSDLSLHNLQQLNYPLHQNNHCLLHQHLIYQQHRWLLNQLLLLNKVNYVLCWWFYHASLSLTTN